MTETDDKVTMEDYLDGDEESTDSKLTEPAELPDDYEPHTCDNCGRSFDHLGSRASKVRAKHERHCDGDPDA